MHDNFDEVKKEDLRKVTTKEKKKEKLDNLDDNEKDQMRKYEKKRKESYP